MSVTQKYFYILLNGKQILQSKKGVSECHSCFIQPSNVNNSRQNKNSSLYGWMVCMDKNNTLRGLMPITVQNLLRFETSVRCIHKIHRLPQKLFLALFLSSHCSSVHHVFPPSLRLLRRIGNDHSATMISCWRLFVESGRKVLRHVKKRQCKRPSCLHSRAVYPHCLAQ